MVRGVTPRGERTVAVITVSVTSRTALTLALTLALASPCGNRRIVFRLACISLHQLNAQLPKLFVVELQEGRERGRQGGGEAGGSPLVTSCDE